MQFSRLAKLLNVVKSTDDRGEDTVTLPLSTFLMILRAALHSSPIFDESHYLSSRPDVRDAIKAGKIASARNHFARTGFFEDVPPGKIAIDEAYYLQSNPDVALAFRKRQIKDPQQHFETCGYREGRLPKPNFSIWEII